MQVERSDWSCYHTSMWSWGSMHLLNSGGELKGACGWEGNEKVGERDSDFEAKI